MVIAQESTIMGSFPVTSRSQLALDKYNEAAEKYLNLQYIDSEKLFNEAIAEDPEFAVALATKAWTTYSKDTLKAKALMSRANVRYYALTYPEQTYLEGINALIHKRHALPYFEILAEKYPDCEFLNAALANLYFKAGNEEKMYATLSAILDKNQSFAWAYNLKGYYYMQQEDFESARLAFDKYLELAPELANPYDSKGDYFMAVKKFDKAREHFTKAYEMDPLNFQFSQTKAIEAEEALASNY